MGWKDLLASSEPQTLTLPWLGGRKVHGLTRSWKLQGKTPPEYGWYEFSVVRGRKVRLASEEPVGQDYDFRDEKRILRGYLVGDRFIRDGAHVDPDPDRLVEQTEPVFCVDLGLERFTRAEVYRDREGRLLYLGTLFPEGPEEEAIMAFQDRKENLDDVKGVTPALDLAFHWITWGRARAEERARELARLRAEEEARLAAMAEEERRRAEQQARLAEAQRNIGTGAGRRAMAEIDFEAAARAALAVSGAELLDIRNSPTRGEKIVQYRYRHRRLECVVNATTLQIIDSGVCLDDHRGTKGDTWFTLESLPAVIGWVMDNDRLVVWRHVNGDVEDDDEDW